MEAVLAHVLGPPVDVAPLAASLTADSSEFDFRPNQLTGGESFGWSYRGLAENLAYLTVKADNVFTVFGIAGHWSGSVNLAELTGGDDISHVGFWTTSVSKTAPVAPKRLHGQGCFGNSGSARSRTARSSACTSRPR